MMKRSERHFELVRLALWHQEEFLAEYRKVVPPSNEPANILNAATMILEILRWEFPPSESSAGRLAF